MAEVVSELELPEFDITDAGLAGDAYHERLAEAGKLGWLVKSQIAYLVLDREAGEFFLRARQTAFPGREIAEVIGAPAQDAAALHEWSSLVQRQFDIRALAAEPERIERAVGELYDYVAGLLDQRRSEPADDLISALLRVEAEGERLSGPECVNLVLNVLAGGVDTTAAQLAHALRLFAGHPEQWEGLRQRPELVGRAVDEVLRFEPITPFTARICTEQVEHRGVIFPAGTIVAICAERANREMGERGDGERFDITAGREDRLLTFGAGPLSW